MMPLDNIILTCNKFECIHSFLLIIILILRLYGRKNYAFLVHKKIHTLILVTYIVYLQRLGRCDYFKG